MPRKEFVRLMEENVLILDRLADKLKMDPAAMSGYPRQLMTVLVRLNMGGAARLKDIARRENVSAPNLCASFRRLEQEGFVVRTTDEHDRRNVLYAVTPAGKELAAKVMENFRIGIEKMFSGISSMDEEKLTGALKTINNILERMEQKNA